MDIETFFVAILVGIAVTFLGGIFPLYQWLVANDLDFVWHGIVGGSVALGCVQYRKKRRSKEK